MDDMSHEEMREHIVQIIIVKLQSFFGMLDTLKNRVREQIAIMKKDKEEKSNDEEMKEESKDELKDPKEDSKEEKRDSPKLQKKSDS